MNTQSPPNKFKDITPDYSLNNSLLFQHLLSEFLTAYRESLIIKDLCKAPIDQHFDQILHTLSKLAGPSQSYMRIFSTNHAGLLSQLSNACWMILLNHGKFEVGLVSMQNELHRTWDSAVQALDIMRILTQSKCEPTLFAGLLEKESLILNKNLNKIVARMQRLSRLIMEVIPQFKDDENVIYFIIRNKDKIAELYGKQFLVKLFTSIYSEGLDEVESLLLNKYKSRSFYHLLPIITQKITEIRISNQNAKFSK